MRIGLLITSVSNFGEKGFYNSQEIGLAKALAKQVESVIVFKLVPLHEEKRREQISKNAFIQFIPAKNRGINGVFDSHEMETEINALIHFSDTQFSVPLVFKWCNRNHIAYLPYIGVIESHSTSKVKRILTNILFRRNLSIYQKIDCCVKTPTVGECLNRYGVKRTHVAPVGLDTDVVKSDYEHNNTEEIKRKYGFKKNEKVILFIGRMIGEKQPLRMVEIFEELTSRDDSYRLIMIGSGELKNEVEKQISLRHLKEKVQLWERIPNCDIWEVYRIADAFVNLNQQEIFGMVILEAMYYGCKVIAWDAPGPNYIIENEVDGYLVSSNDAVVSCIMKNDSIGLLGHEKIVKRFTWDSSAKQMLDILRAKA